MSSAHNTSDMSQPADSPVADGTTVYESALQEYYAKQAAGYFEPAITDTLSHLPQANTFTTNVQAPQIPHPSVPHATIPPRSTAMATASGTTTNIPPATTYSPYGSLPSIPTFSGHLPNLLPHRNPTLSYGPFSSYRPPLSPPQQEVFVPTPDSITFEHISARLRFLLGLNLPDWNSPHIFLLSAVLTDQITTAGKKGELGPDGIGSVEDIFMAVGHEGQWHYMALAVVAPMAVKVLMRGPAYFLDGRNPLKDASSMELLRSGFNDAAWQEWKRAGEMIGRGGRR